MHRVLGPNHCARSRLLAERAQAMRECPSESEQRLWRALRCRGLGVEFRRQVVIAERSIVDFVAPAQKLVVEVDGPYHARRVSADASRDRKLARLGYRVLRMKRSWCFGTYRPRCGRSARRSRDHPTPEPRQSRGGGGAGNRTPVREASCQPSFTCVAAIARAARVCRFGCNLAPCVLGHGTGSGYVTQP
jgi:very-short-patch-repair endonuclease